MSRILVVTRVKMMESMHHFPQPQLAHPDSQIATLPSPLFDDPKHGIRIYHGDSLELLPPPEQRPVASHWE